jgi:putative PIN family toxin of toxin-antitoxin system
MILVLDTNVLVSALLSPLGAPGRVLDLLLRGDVRLAFDDRILDEYRSVLARPKFGFEPRLIDDLLTLIIATGVGVSAPVLSFELPDSDDLMFLEAATAADATLVTGNLKHYPVGDQVKVRIQSPAAYIEWWRANMVAD